jgi:hypothetical protein
MGGGSMAGGRAGGGGFANAPSTRGSFGRGTRAGSSFAMRSGPTNRGFVQGRNWSGRNWSGRNWNRGWHGRHFRHRSGIAFGFGPFFYDDTCYRLVLVRGVWQRVWVCY